MQQRRVLRDHADVAAQRILRDLGNVLPVDQDASALQIVKAQQQVDQRRFAGTRTADETDLFTRRHGERHVVYDATARARIAKAGVVEAHFAARHDEFSSRRHVEHRTRQRQCLHAVLHRADVLEQARHLPHDPVRHALQPQGHRGRCRYRSDSDCAVRPQPQRHAAHAGGEPHAEGVVRNLEEAYQPHLPVAGVHELAHRVSRKAGLALCMREQLDGRDVGVCIGDAAGHQGARIGLRLADLAQAWHEESELREIKREPDHEGPYQLRVQHGDQHDHGRDVDAHCHQHVGQYEDGVAHRQRRLHHFGRDATGKLVLVEGHALTQHQSVEVPAQPHWQIHRQRLVLDDGLQRNDSNACRESEAQPHQRGAALFP